MIIVPTHIKFSKVLRISLLHLFRLGIEIVWKLACQLTIYRRSRQSPLSGRNLAAAAAGRAACDSRPLPPSIETSRLQNCLPVGPLLPLFHVVAFICFLESFYAKIEQQVLPWIFKPAELLREWRSFSQITSLLTRTLTHYKMDEPILIQTFKRLRHYFVT